MLKNVRLAAALALALLTPRPALCQTVRQLLDRAAAERRTAQLRSTARRELVPILVKKLLTDKDPTNLGIVCADLREPEKMKRRIAFSPEGLVYVYYVSPEMDADAIVLLGPGDLEKIYRRSADIDADWLVDPLAAELSRRGACGKRMKLSAEASFLPTGTESAEAVPKGVAAVRGVSGVGYPVSLVVGESFVKGEANGGYPADLSIDRTGGACLIEGTFNGGYPARVSMEGGRARGEAMGGYPVDLTVTGTSVTGVVQGGYAVTLAISSRAAHGGVQGTAPGGYPMKLEITGELDACRLVAALLPALHRRSSNTRLAFSAAALAAVDLATKKKMAGIVKSLRETR